MRGDQRRDDLRVRRGAERNAALQQLVVQLQRIDQIAVVRQRDLPARAVRALRALHRLGVLPRVGSRRRVAHVPDRQLPRQRAQVVLAEHLAHQPQLAARDDMPAAVRRGDARRLLAAVLQRIQCEVRQARDLVAGCI